MKKVNEMTNAELEQNIKVMETIDSPEAKKLVNQFVEELDKRKAEAEAKRKAEEAKKAEMEAKREAEAEDKELAMFDAQRGVIGKCYKKVFYNTNYLKPTIHYTVYYKVLGVYENVAIVSFVKEYEHSEMISKAITYININDLLDKNEHYDVISLKDFNKECAKTKLTLDCISDMFTRLLQFPY